MNPISQNSDVNTHPGRPSRWRRFGLSGLAGVALLVLTGYTFPRQLLCVDTGAGPADVLVVLGGETGPRAAHAAELFHQGIAPRVIVTGDGEDQDGQRVLLAAGVPAEAIELEKEAANTQQNAEFTVRMLRQRGAQRVVLVTSWFHSRRALRCFRSVAPEIQFASSPSYHDVRLADWVRTPAGYQLGLEYVKFVYYWLRYGIAPG